MTLFDRLAGIAPTSPHEIGLSGPDGAFSHSELAARADHAAAVLMREHAIAPGDRVMYLGYNTAALIVLLFAASRAGFTLCPMNWRLADDELRWMLGDAEPSLIVADAAHLDKAHAISTGQPILPGATLVAAPPADAPAERATGASADIPANIPANTHANTLANAHANAHANAPDRNRTEPDTPLLLVYTSGATGRPKGALLTQPALLANAAMAWDMHDMTAHDHVLTALPLFHVGGLNIQTLPALLCGARVTLMDRFEPAACIEAIATLRPTLTVQVPATFGALMSSPGWDALDLGCLRAIATGSTDVPVTLIEAVHARGVPVIQIYGATETGPVVVYQTPADARAQLGSIGRAGPGVTASIRRPDGTEAPDGEVGEIWLQSPTLAQGYWRNRAADTAFADGWFRTGDMARRAPDGFLWFADRLKNVIISGGENIYPAELERILAETDGIEEACVVGRADPRWGAVPVAVVGGSATRETVLAAFDGRLARFKHPKDVVFVEALPRNAMGKVEVAAVRALLPDPA